MTNKQKLIEAAICTVLSVSALTVSAKALANNDSGQQMENTTIDGIEKCYGIVKAGMNDCGTANHNCSGQAKVDNSLSEWIALPTGTCSKITGGQLKSGNDKPNSK
jgi:uncharacterized membrane protein